jgi:magnesium-transporting ATPase (P-type)
MYTTQSGQSLIASWGLLARDVIERLGPKFDSLIRDEASRKLDIYESNLQPIRKEKALSMCFLAQLKKPLIVIMLIGTSTTFFLGHYMDAGIIMGFVLLSILLGVVNEKLASREINNVLATVPISLQVMRDQESLHIPIEEPVPGDVRIFDAEDVVTSDYLSLK